MSLNILESIKGIFNNDLISKAATSVGEPENGVQKVVNGAVPAILLNLLHKSDTPEGASSVFSLVNNAVNSVPLNNPAGSLPLVNAAEGASSNVTSNLFGDKLSGLVNSFSGFSGIKQSSVSSLLGWVTPLVLGLLGKHAKDNNLGAAGLTDALKSQKDAIASAIPSGLNLTGILGLGSLAGLGGKISSMAASAGADIKHKSAEVTQEVKKSGSKWLLPLIIIIAAVLLIGYLMKSCNGKTDTVATGDTAVNTTADSTITDNTGPVSVKVKLPDGTELDAYKGGIEDRLVAYLNSTDAADSISKTRWFDFDNLNFKSGSSEITDSSRVQINNIAAILKAYPKAKIKLGGYTDKTGDSTVNLKLSQQRAEATLAAIKKAGANAAQLTGAEGYGSKFATVEASAPDEQRKKDRHISVNVKEK
ncbi:DUF937 domain-containing protein [Parafilimonas sp.]|uniref:DUF937 domain-containing protein n=1 Tax=Parafilimonas sp. TaxID=1969739 RepID=UPI0039E5D5FB